jgi:hypothetical protein
MIRHLLSFVVIAAILISCSNTGKKEGSAKADGSKSSVKVEFASLLQNPDNYVGKNIIVEGKVVHVCTETGKKMFIVGENPDVRLYVAAGENISKFPMELLGNEVIVEGTITKVGGPALEAGEKPMNSMECMAKTMGGDSCETEKALAGQSSLANIIMEYKSHTVK